MIHLTDAQIDEVIDFEHAIPVLEIAFRQHARGAAAVQRRVRTEAGGTKLSTLGAVLPDADVAGAKIYTTIRGQFNFAIILFRASDGQCLATLNANAITRLRTAATTVLAVRRLAHSGAHTAAIFGTGVQGRAHAHALAAFTELKTLRIVGVEGDAQLAHALNEAHRARGVAASAMDTARALDGADVIVTATRATTPLFDGNAVMPGALVAAIGSSLPHAREIDDTALSRASRIVVELRDQSRDEAGDLVLAAPGVVDWSKVVELGEVLEDDTLARQRDDEIIVYKAVGIGLQDVALAALAYRRFVERNC
ncbi:ornithine cyclodeaminase family protein [Paraburkholderia sp. MMS20-SJTR3]|uniref:Ornithine cyclodeaminase family protein n=1 Tax=Paraburkholderia sejongensis TaxID=2886946 RepID=A0ABS8K648_9BURK|nr:ornithine cyclodeaminase family protein [Paraburkholderia sp. MMS20-SJTR3]MCC8397621.1 ornithine cyclodeaminase family protein [Paraburkholderia sp. MMS20-SJTR3]